MGKMRELLNLTKKITLLENAYASFFDSAFRAAFRKHRPNVDWEDAKCGIETYHRKIGDLRGQHHSLLQDAAIEFFSWYNKKRDESASPDEIAALWELVAVKFKNDSASIEELLEFMEV